MSFLKKRKGLVKPQENVLLLNSKTDECTFHGATKFSLKLAQYFSYFPIDIGETSRDLKFKWLHWRVFYALLTFLFFVAELIAVICYHFCPHSQQDTMLFVTIIMFYGGAVAQYILFFKLTLEWESFVNEWHKIEVRMKTYQSHCNLRMQLNTITTIIMFIAGGSVFCINQENFSFRCFTFCHFLILTKLYSAIKSLIIEHALVNAKKFLKCLATEPTIYEAFKIYFTKSYTHIFTFLEYSIWKGIIAQFLNLQRTFNWTYADVFIMMIGWSFTFRMRQIRKKLEILCRLKINDVNSFRNNREDYVKIIALSQTINKRISFIIILCFTLNMYFILVQLFSSLGTMDSTVEKAYFYISFGLLVLRITGTCILGGEVFEEWNNIGSTLFSVQSTAYNIEVQRFIDHAITYEVVLTGRNFFRITRSLILKIASAIVTYELILLQFNSAALQSNSL